MLLKRMAVMLMGRVRNQMSAELLGVGPGAGQIEPSATGAPHHTATNMEPVPQYTLLQSAQAPHQKNTQDSSCRRWNRCNM